MKNIHFCQNLKHIICRCHCNNMVNFTKYNEYFVDILGEKFMKITSQKYLMKNKSVFKVWVKFLKFVCIKI